MIKEASSTELRELLKIYGLSALLNVPHRVNGRPTIGKTQVSGQFQFIALSNHTNPKIRSQN